MLRAVIVLLLVVSSCEAFASDATQQARAALVIGNGNYRSQSLKNPGNDAAAISAALARLGFDTKTVRDADSRGLDETVRTFVDRTQDHEVRVLFYAGHGARIQGKNYLLPVETAIELEDDIKRRGLDIDEVLDRMSRARKGISILILDACRINPALQVQLTANGRKIQYRGTPNLSGTLVAYSTSPGSVADDNAAQDNGLYTKHLLSHLETPGLALEQLFKRVRSGVILESQNRQIPWEATSLTTDFCFRVGARGECR